MMRTLLCTLLVSPVLAAQTSQAPPSALNAIGDPIGTVGGGHPAPGDVWDTIVHSYARTDGVAPYNGNLLVALNEDGLARVFEINPNTGDEVASYPVADDDDAWLGYDTLRDLIITTNAVIDRIRGYSPGNGVPVFDIPSPTPGPVGMAYDPGRDEYVYCDWESDQVVVLDASTLTVTRFFDLPLQTMVGVAFDCSNDTYVVGERATATHSVLDPTDGSILLSFPTVGSMVSDPRGAALSNDGGIWTGDFITAELFELESGHGMVPAACAGEVGVEYCLSVANSTGAAASITGLGSTSVGTDWLTLVASPVPDQPGIFFYGATPMQSAFGDGFLCVDAPVARLDAELAVDNALTHSLDLTDAPPGFDITAGATWNFQAWFRDPAAGGAGFNLSTALEVTFTP